MLNILIFSTYKQNLLLKIRFQIILIIFLSNARVFNSQEKPNECDLDPSLNNVQCFNNIIKFEHKHYQSSNLAISKNGDLVIEFSEDNEISSSRLFYGLTKDGRYFFKNQSSYTYELNIDNENIEEFVHLDLNNKISNLFVFIIIIHGLSKLFLI